MRSFDTLASEIDWGAFESRVMRPERAPMGEAARLARELAAERVASKSVGRAMPTFAMTRAIWLAEPSFLRDAWETMTTRLDGEWLFAPPPDGRVFLPFVPLRRIEYGTDRRPEPSDRPRFYDPRPFELETMVAMLSAPRSEIVAAEEAALEAAARLEPWGGTVARRVAWTWVGREWPRDPSWPTAFDAPKRAATFVALPDTGQLSPSVRMGPKALPVGPGPLRRAAGLADAWVRWRRAVAEGGRVTIPSFDRSIPWDLDGWRFSKLPDVLDPLLVVLGLGYMPIDVRGEFIVLGFSLPPEVSDLSGNQDAVRYARQEARRRFGAKL